MLAPINAAIPSITSGVVGGARGIACANLQTLAAAATKKADAWRINYVCLRVDMEKAYSSLKIEDAGAALLTFGVAPEVVLGIMRESLGQRLESKLCGVDTPTIPLVSRTPEGAPHSGSLLRAVVAKAIIPLLAR